MSRAVSYSRRIAKLRAQIFGELPKEIATPDKRKIVSYFAERPTHKELPYWYPPIEKFNSLLHELRFLGLHRDEHLDFAEKMKAVRKSKGKGPPPKGKGKRAKKS